MISKKTFTIKIIAWICVFIAAVAMSWKYFVGSENRTFIYTVKNEDGLRRIFTQLDEDIYSLEPEHAVELILIGESHGRPLYDITYIFDLDGNGDYPPMTVTGEAEEYTYPVSGLTAIQAGPLYGETVVDGVACDLSVTFTQNASTGDMCSTVDIIPQDEELKEPFIGFENSIIITIGQPIVTYDFLLEEGLVPAE